MLQILYKKYYNNLIAICSITVINFKILSLLKKNIYNNLAWILCIAAIKHNKEWKKTLTIFKTA